MPQHLHQGDAWLTVAPGMPPHAGMPVRTAGTSAVRADVLVLLVHGRGASAQDILSLGDAVGHETAFLVAPQASGSVWYPFSFLSPLAANEPGLSSALSVLDGIVHEAERSGFPPKHVVLMGFSQGACLALEFAARHAKRFGGIVGLSGGLIGPEGTPRSYAGSFAETPVYLGCSIGDPHIPSGRVEETAAVFRSMGAAVQMKLFDKLGHTVNDEELRSASAIIAGAAKAR